MDLYPLQEGGSPFEMLPAKGMRLCGLEPDALLKGLRRVIGDDRASRRVSHEIMMRSGLAGTPTLNLRYAGRLPSDHLPLTSAFYVYYCSAQGRLRLATIGDSRHPGKRGQNRRVAIYTHSLLFVLYGLVLELPGPQ